MAEPDDFAVNASVAPGRVLGGEAKDDLPELDRGWWPSRSTPGLCPVTGYAAAVPAQKRVGGDEPTRAQPSGECGRDRAEQSPVVVVERGSIDLAAENVRVPETRPCALAWGFAGCQSKAVALEELQEFDLLIAGMLISRRDEAFRPHKTDPIQPIVNIC